MYSAVLRQAAHLDGKHDIDCANDIVVLGVNSASSVDHGVGRASLLSKVDNRIGLEADKHIFQELPVTDVSYLQVNMLARNLAPPAHVCLQKWHSCDHATSLR